MLLIRLALTMVLFASPALADADWIVHGGPIHTLRGDQPSTVEAIAIHDGAVVAVGDLDDVLGYADKETVTLDLDGATAMPGLVDAHAHLFKLGRILTQVDLRGTASRQACLDLAVAAAADLPAGEWLLGRGWDQNDWEVQEYPTKADLDALFPDRPVYLRRVDGHAGWANSVALESAGFDADTPDPQGGEFLRDADGLTGILIDEADEAMLDAIPDEGPEQLDRLVDVAAASIAAHGLTGLHEMGLKISEWQALQRAEAQGRLPIRVVGYLGGDEALADYEGGPVRPGPDARLRLEGVKLYADGALGSRGAALLEDYRDRPGHRGLLIVDPDELTARAARAFARDFTVTVHAIGDRGNRIALDALEQGYAAAKEARPQLLPLAAMRARVEHVQVLAPGDVGRFARTGILPSMQPTHCTSDMPWAPDRLGPDRLAGAYAWRTLRDSGVAIPLGSDFPVEGVSPLLGLYAAITRQAPDGTPEGGWAPEERLTRLEALLGFTAWAADAAGVPQWGRLNVGSRADLTVLSVDPLTCPPADLLRAEVAWTMVDGERRVP